LAEGEASVTELAQPFAISLPAVSRHLRVLEKAGLISQGREAQWRPRRLEAAPLRAADEWMTPYRAFFDERLDRLEQHLATMVAAAGHPTENAADGSTESTTVNTTDNPTEEGTKK